ncbi:helix-turn-helix domain-containing protein [Nocardia sp. FBN12]|uniref:helix-turn-helix domain-containing protein n=1 Tax=Nocardia sp. FBN12 TaxID=3419766 RepID=UPI003D044CB5
MRPWRKQSEPLDLTGDDNIRNAMELTQARRRLFNDLIGIRVHRGISQAKVADAIGINRSGISRFEVDIETSNPTFDVVLRYAHAVGAALTLRAEPMEARELSRLPEVGEEFVWHTRMRAGALGVGGFIPDSALAETSSDDWMVDQEAAAL